MQTKKLNCILLVDDDATTNFLNQRLLTKMGVATHLSVARNGIEALDYLNQSQSQSDQFPLPELILLDLNMPLMDGWEFLEAYQQLPSDLRQSLVIVMLTTSLREEDHQRAQQISEVRNLINKPLNRDMVQAVLDQYFSDNPIH